MQVLRFCAVLAAAAVVAAGAWAAPPTPATSPAVDTPTKRLAHEHERVTLVEMPLAKVLGRYAALSGLKLKADWGSLKAAGITPKTPVTLKAYRLSFEKLLNLTLDSIARRNRPLAWYLAGDTVTVSTQMAVLYRGQSFVSVPVPAVRARGRIGGLGAVHFPGLKLEDVFQFMRDVSGMNIHVNWRTLQAAGIDKDTQITLKVHGVSFWRLLDLLTDHLSAGRDRFSSVYWVRDRNVIHIATGDALNQTTKVMIFDVGDLLMTIPNFEGPRTSLSGTGNRSSTPTGAAAGPAGGAIDLFAPAGGAAPRAAATSDADRRREQQEGLIEAIKDSIGEEMWKPTGRGSIRIIRGKMIISQTTLGFKLMEKSTAR